jgi:hypothetical protein
MALIQALSSVHSILQPETVDTLQFLDYVATFRVLNRSAFDIYSRVDNIDPSIGGDGSLLIPVGSEVFLMVPDTANPEIRLISVGVAAYSVEKH